MQVETKELDVASAEFGGFVVSLFSKIRRLRLDDPADHAALEGLVNYATNKIGRELLAAQGEPALDRALDNIALGHEVYHLNALFARCVTLGGAPVVKVNGFAEAAQSVLPFDARQQLTAGEAVLNAWLRAQIQAVASVDAQRTVAVADLAGPWLLTSLDVPPKVALAILGALHAMSCLLAISLAIDEHIDLPVWLANSLVAHMVEGASQHLRLLAGLEHVDVPEGILPRSERLDVQQLVQDNLVATRVLRHERRPQT